MPASKHTRAQKVAALARLDKGERKEDVARDLKVSYWTLVYWRNTIGKLREPRPAC